MSTDPVRFLAARLDEEAAAAKRAASVAGPDWVHDTGWSETDQPYSLIRSLDGVIVADALSGPDDEETGPFIARHDPARALREIEADRRILARYQDCLARMEDPDYPQGVARDQAREYEDFVLPNLLVKWDDHPEYDQEWRP